MCARRDRYYREMAGSTIPRVAITGIGVVSPFGVGRDCFWRHVRRGCSGTRAIADFDASAFSCTVAAPIPPVSIDDATPINGRAPDERGGRADPRRYSRASLIAVIAATEAWADAGLRLNEPGAGVLVGSGAGGIDVAERQFYEFFTDGKRVTPYAIPVSIVGMEAHRRRRLPDIRARAGWMAPLRSPADVAVAAVNLRHAPVDRGCALRVSGALAGRSIRREPSLYVFLDVALDAYGERVQRLHPCVV